jgi:hypothetical protein
MQFHLVYVQYNEAQNYKAKAIFQLILQRDGLHKSSLPRSV